MNRAEIHIPEYRDLPYTNFPYLLELDKLLPPGDTELRDCRYNHFRRTGHPYSIAYIGLWLLDNYHTTQDEKYIRAIKPYIDELLNTATIAGDALFLPYQFDFWLHSRHKDTEHMISPWYSGMAQGVGLTLFSRLYGVTGNPKYLGVSQQLLNSLYIRTGGVPWVTLRDDAGYFWIEEYPLAKGQSDRTLNGFLFAIYGLYNYLWNTGNEDAYPFIVDAIETVKHYLPEYRNPGGISHYCLKHKDIMDAPYHMVCTDQLSRLHKYSGDDVLGKYAALFKADYYDPKFKKAYPN
jgi:hypothetical protein